MVPSWIRQSALLSLLIHMLISYGNTLTDTSRIMFVCHQIPCLIFLLFCTSIFSSIVNAYLFLYPLKQRSLSELDEHAYM
uniref:Uncharacterized protein n=1 Tax=Sus scrofa TaxID=9823 RepID=A0A4X1SVZ6_PIG